MFYERYPRNYQEYFQLPILVSSPAPTRTLDVFSAVAAANSYCVVRTGSYLVHGYVVSCFDQHLVCIARDV